MKRIKTILLLLTVLLLTGIFFLFAFKRRPTSVELTIETERADFQIREQPVLLEWNCPISTFAIWNFKEFNLFMIDLREITPALFDDEEDSLNIPSDENRLEIRNKIVSIRPIKDTEFQIGRAHV